MGKLTSPMGRKLIPYLVVYLLGVVTAAGVFEVRIWQHWQGEAAAQVAEEHQTALEMADLGQRQAQVVARALVEGEGQPGCAPDRLPDGFVKLGPDGTKTVLRHTR